MPKRIGNLYDSIISMENLRLAESKARKGKTDTYGVRLFDRNREENLERLHEQLLTHTYKTSPYSLFTIQEPKERLIYRLPYYPDRIVHHAIMNILEPIWVKVFPYNTYSCIKDRGIDGARRRVMSILKDPEQSRYCLKIDIRKFYPSIRHDVAKRIIRRKIKCRPTLALIDEIIDSVNGCPDPINPDNVCDGWSLPIGNYLSQFIANLVLSYLLHKVNTFPGIKAVLYADDGTFFAKDKETLHRLLAFLKDELQRDLGLTLKDNYQIFPVAKNKEDRHGRGVDFVGFVFYHEQTQIRKSIKKHFAKKVNRLNRRDPLLPVSEYKQAIAPWLGWAKYSNSKHLLQTLINKDEYKSILQ